MGIATGENAPLIGESNIENLGALIYERYVFIFLAAGLVLLVAMVGAIVLTHRESKNARGHQDIGRQVARDPKTATVLKAPPVGQGIDL